MDTPSDDQNTCKCSKEKNEKRKAGGEEESRSGSSGKSISSSASPPPSTPSGCCYRFHSRQEVDRRIASFPAPYRAVADYLFWKAFHAGRNRAGWSGGTHKECTCGVGRGPISIKHQAGKPASAGVCVVPLTCPRDFCP